MCAKHYENPTTLSRVTAKNVGDVFLRHTVDGYPSDWRRGIQSEKKEMEKWLNSAHPLNWDRIVHPSHVCSAVPELSKIHVLSFFTTVYTVVKNKRMLLEY